MKTSQTFFFFALLSLSQSACSLFGCLKCSDNDPDICIECSASLVLHKNSCKSLGVLPSIIPFCAEYFTNDLCMSCDADYALINNTCIPLQKNDSSDLSLSSSNRRQLFTCSVSNCLSCSSKNYCATCSKGFFAINGVCRCYCPDNCQVCYSPCSSCTSCYSGYLLTSSGCQFGSTLCSDPYCLTCSSYSYCNSCKTGAYVYLGSCYCYCPDKCQTCSTCDSCKVCKAGYQLNSNSLCVYSSVTCTIKNCLSCSSTNYCSSCASGYYLSSGWCYCNCPAHCNTCSNSCSTCYACNSGYTLNSYGKCVLGSNCIVNNCLTCSTDNYCSICNSGYYLSNGKCLISTCFDAECLVCTNHYVCTSCSSGYTLSSGYCVLQNSKCPSSCLKCENLSTCSICSDGYYLSAGSCLSCPQYCTMCTSLICYECTLGYSLDRHDSCVSSNATFHQIRMALNLLCYLLVSNSI